MNTRYTLAAALTCALATTGAHAAPVSVDYAGQFVPLEGEFLFLDLFGDDSSFFDGADGSSDLSIGENPGGDSGRFGVDSRFVNDFVFQQGDIARDADNNLITYQNGDFVDEDDFQGSQDTAILYGGSGLNGFPEAPDGIIPDVGDTVILGFRFQYFTDLFFGEEGQVLEANGIDDELGECYFEEEEEGEGDFCEPQRALLATYYGYIQITHGSVIPGIIGYDDQSGQAAEVIIPPTVPAVPLPAAGWMLLAGVGGLAAAKRRRKG